MKQHESDAWFVDQQVMCPNCPGWFSVKRHYVQETNSYYFYASHRGHAADHVMTYEAMRRVGFGELSSTIYRYTYGVIDVVAREAKCLDYAT